MYVNLIKLEQLGCEALRQHGLDSQPSDLARAMGVSVDKDGYCSYWTGSKRNFKHIARMVDSLSGVEGRHCIAGSDVYNDTYGVRVVLGGCEHTLPVGDVVEYGHFPQTIVGEDLDKKLTGLLNTGVLNKTGVVYSIPFERYTINLPEYEHNGGRYVLIKAYSAENLETKNKRKIYKDRHDFFWVKVEPIKWFVDPAGILITRDCLVASRGLIYVVGNEETWLDFYVRKDFAKQILHIEEIKQRLMNAEYAKLDKVWNKER